MKTKSIRIPKDMMAAIELVEKAEKIEESTATGKICIKINSHSIFLPKFYNQVKSN